jgi:hypothetical protein
MLREGLRLSLAHGGGGHFATIAVQNGAAAAIKVDGEGLSAKVTVGGRDIRFDGERSCWDSRSSQGPADSHHIGIRLPTEAVQWVLASPQTGRQRGPGRARGLVARLSCGTLCDCVWVRDSAGPQRAGGPQPADATFRPISTDLRRVRWVTITRTHNVPGAHGRSVVGDRVNVASQRASHAGRPLRNSRDPPTSGLRGVCHPRPKRRISWRPAKCSET